MTRVDSFDQCALFRCCVGVQHFDRFRFVYAESHFHREIRASVSAHDGSFRTLSQEQHSDACFGRLSSDLSNKRCDAGCVSICWFQTVGCIEILCALDDSGKFFQYEQDER
ncbi:hypothetical protein DKY64_21065 [Stenotrophomonas maltophilia]|nr:hypothetical protein DKY64_21065 [Stenotrophomonas maltophilia]